MNNLEPRAKIGDVVKRVKFGNVDELEITCAYLHYPEDTSKSHWMYNFEKKDESCFYDKDILKNLTTNVSYE